MISIILISFPCMNRDNSLMNEAFSPYSIEAFLDQSTYCLRSMANDVIPVFEIDGVYGEGVEQVLNALEEQVLSEPILELFNGIGLQELESGVLCHISDNRGSELIHRTVILRSSSSESSSCDYKDQSSSEESDSLQNLQICA